MAENNEYINIISDGGVKKRIIMEGQGENPINGCRFFISYTEKNVDSKISNRTQNINSVFNIGFNRVIKGWEIAIKTMKVGEKSEFIIGPKYSSYLKSIKGLNSIYEIELIKFEMPREKKLGRDLVRKLSEDKKVNKDNIIRLKDYKTKENKINGKKLFKNRFHNNYTYKNISINKKRYYSLNKVSKYGMGNYEILKVKTDSPICIKCFRLIYISFNFIKNYISTKCSYCNKFDIYSYNNFLEKITKNDNPLINSSCYKCSKMFMFSKRLFYLIETKDFNFYVICGLCLEKEKEKQSTLIGLIIGKKLI